MEIKRRYRDCMVCGEHVAEITNLKNGHGHSEVRYFSNADVLAIARSGKIFCKNCTNMGQKNE